MHQYLSIRVGLEPMAVLFQLRSKSGEAIDFTIEDKVNSALFVVNWIQTLRQVDDGEAADTQTHRPMCIVAFVIWPSMDLRITHSFGCGGVADSMVEAYFAGDAAHRWLGSSGSYVGLLTIVPLALIFDGLFESSNIRLSWPIRLGLCRREALSSIADVV
jgi:hypothetical protein